MDVDTNDEVLNKNKQPPELLFSCPPENVQILETSPVLSDYGK